MRAGILRRLESMVCRTRIQEGAGLWPCPSHQTVMRMAAARMALLAMPILLAQGCAQAPEVDAMVPHLKMSTAARTEKTLAIVRAKGGAETNPFMAPVIENEGFRHALKIAIERAGLFRKVFYDQNGDYLLYPEIVVQDVVAGLSMTSVLTVRYRLVEAWTRDELWNARVPSRYDAALAEALYGLSRVRKAQEGSVRENLRAALEQLGKFIARDRASSNREG